MYMWCRACSYPEWVGKRVWVSVSMLANFKARQVIQNSVSSGEAAASSASTDNDTCVHCTCVCVHVHRRVRV